MTPLETGLIFAGVAIVFLAIIIYVVPWLIRKHIPVQTYITLGEDALNAIKNIIEPLLPPADQTIVNTLVKYAELAVQYAEQLYASGQVSADQRKQAALTFVENAAKAAGITLTPTEITFIDAAIEAAVYLLPETNKTIVTPVPTPTPLPSGTVVASGTNAADNKNF